MNQKLKNSSHQVQQKISFIPIFYKSKLYSFTCKIKNVTSFPVNFKSRARNLSSAGVKILFVCFACKYFEYAVIANSQ